VFYSPEDVAELCRDAELVDARFRALRQDFIAASYHSTVAQEHAHHGFSRRLGTMARCVARLFDLLPPDLNSVPEDGVTIDAAIYIQAFIFNSFGCCENLAWIWVHERDIRDGQGRPLRPNRIGLGPNCNEVRETFSDSFRQTLAVYDDWFGYLKDYRDALAHRIPLYIPPWSIDPSLDDNYRALDAAATAALMAYDFDGNARLIAQRDALRHFTPVITHSLVSARPIQLHPQLLNDFDAIADLGQGILSELAALAHEPLPK
jgi:hypothetical protein